MRAFTYQGGACRVFRTWRLEFTATSTDDAGRFIAKLIKYVEVYGFSDSEGLAMLDTAFSGKSETWLANNEDFHTSSAL